MNLEKFICKFNAGTYAGVSKGIVFHKEDETTVNVIMTNTFVYNIIYLEFQLISTTE